MLKFLITTRSCWCLMIAFSSDVNVLICASAIGFFFIVVKFRPYSKYVFKYGGTMLYFLKYPPAYAYSATADYIPVAVQYVRYMISAKEKKTTTSKGPISH